MADAGRQAGEVFLLPPPAGLEPVSRPDQLLRARAVRGQLGDDLGDPPFQPAGSEPAIPSTWMKNCPARRAGACRASTQVASLSCSTRVCQSRDRRPR